jgi:hypothetical protein
MDPRGYKRSRSVIFPHLPTKNVVIYGAPEFVAGKVLEPCPPEETRFSPVTMSRSPNEERRIENGKPHSRRTERSSESGVATATVI